jgi:hypothetical protein
MESQKKLISDTAVMAVLQGHIDFNGTRKENNGVHNPNSKAAK